MVTIQLLLLTLVLILTSVEKFSYGVYYNATGDELLGKWYIIRWTTSVFLPEKKKASPLPPFIFIRNIIGKLEFRMNISKPIGCIEFKIYMDEIKPGTFSIWPSHRISITFMHGKDFAFAAYKYDDEDISHITAMLMGRNLTPKQQLLLEFEELMKLLGLKQKDINSPKCDYTCELYKET